MYYACACACYSTAAGYCTCTCNNASTRCSAVPLVDDTDMSQLIQQTDSRSIARRHVHSSSCSVEQFLTPIDIVRVIVPFIFHFCLCLSVHIPSIRFGIHFISCVLHSHSHSHVQALKVQPDHMDQPDHRDQPVRKDQKATLGPQDHKDRVRANRNKPCICA